ncbi:MAG: NAD(P)H:quinone oxidoreductase [Pseudomonadota bacterium]
MNPVLVMYYSRHGSTLQLAEKIADGAESAGCEALMRCVPEVSDNLDGKKARVPDAGNPYVTKQDLIECSALALGAPTHFGNMPAPMKYFWDSTTDLWLKGSLVDKPACVFTSTSSMHGGQESTLLSMMLPLLHHGMCLMGVPYTEAALHETKTGGTPYGVSHVSTRSDDDSLSDDEVTLAMAMGKRLALWAKKK